MSCGGVMKQEQLLSLIKAELFSLLNGYIEIPPINEYITTPGLQDNSGIVGCLLLANEIDVVY